MKKLLIISNSQFGYGMGYHHIVEYLYDVYDIDFYCFKTDLPFVNNDRVNFLYYPYIYGENRYIRILKFSFEAIKLTYQKKYDVVIVSQGYLDILIGLLSKSKLKVNYLLTGDLSNIKLKRFIKNFQIKLFSFPFDKIFVLSNGMQNLLRLSKKKTIVIPLGSTSISSNKKKYNKMHFVYLGTFFKRNIEITIASFIKFYKNFKDKISLKYYLIGVDDQEIWNNIEKLIIEHNLENIIILTGKKNHYELIEVFDDCTIGVGFVPQTEYYEYQPSTKIIEYALSGLITIATDTFENRMMINKDNGVICQDNEESFYNASEYIYKNLYDYHEIKIRESLSENSWKNIVKNKLLPAICNND